MGVSILKGCCSKSLIIETAFNFLRTIPFVIILAIITIKSAHFSLDRILLAALSAVIISGIGDTIWFTALSGLSFTQAAMLHLLVHVITAIGGIIFVSESISLLLAVSSTIILVSILMLVLGRDYYVQLQIGGKTQVRL